jgi:GNAT superfamily N-acetyltransferase
VLSEACEANVGVIDLQAHYQEIYGGGDETPLAAAEFVPPVGYFVVGYSAGVAVACGGWRAREGDEPSLRPGDAEIKRMFVRPTHRGRGFARAVLADLEADAARAGRRRMVLETGVRQHAAIGLYVAAGYAPIAPFGTYRDAEGSRHYGKLLHGGTGRGLLGHGPSSRQVSGDRTDSAG